MIEAKFPPKLRVLFQPSRYKFIRGGRGSGKSWGVARALLIQGAQQPHRILCAREVQESIKQSVHQLLSDQIESLGLGAFYQILRDEIRGANGTMFMFKGLSDMTADSVKSFEGCTRVWLEEAQSISARSWKILVPTIRADGSEIWATYNPELETDETHQRAVVNARPDTISIEVNYCDNPWFPEVLERERLADKEKLPAEEYAHIWEGKCLPAVQGAIYFNEVSAAETEGRVTRVSYDRLLRVHRVWDLGFNDSMSIILAQRAASEIRIIDYIEDSHRTIASYVDECNERAFNWGTDYLPHDGFAVRHQTGKADEEVLSAMGCNVEMTPNVEVEQGIRIARQTFPRIWFNKESEGVSRLLECLKRYRRHVSKATGEARGPVHDTYSHGADAFRYLCLVADQLQNSPPRKKQADDFGGFDGGWMG